MVSPAPFIKAAVGLGVLLIMLLMGPLGYSQTPAKKDKKQEIPLHITASRLEADQEKRLIIFSGRVRAQYGDATLYTDQLWVFYRPSAQESSPSAVKESPELSPLADLGGEKIDRIEARGNVRFVQEDKVATGQQGIYYRDREEIVLTGKPRVWRGENILKGEKIILFLKDNRVLVESSPKQRVEAHLYQTSEQPSAMKGLIPGVSRGAKRDKKRGP